MKTIYFKELDLQSIYNNKKIKNKNNNISINSNYQHTQLQNQYLHTLKLIKKNINNFNISPQLFTKLINKNILHKTQLTLSTQYLKKLNIS